MIAALNERGVHGPLAHVVAELGLLAFKLGFARWSEDDRDGVSTLERHALAALDELRILTTSLK